jgi:hypothetical protein
MLLPAANDYWPMAGLRRRNCAVTAQFREHGRPTDAACALLSKNYAGRRPVRRRPFKVPLNFSVLRIRNENCSFFQEPR